MESDYYKNYGVLLKVLPLDKNVQCTFLGCYLGGQNTAKFPNPNNDGQFKEKIERKSAAPNSSFTDIFRQKPTKRKLGARDK